MEGVNFSMTKISVIEWRYVCCDQMCSSYGFKTIVHIDMKWQSIQKKTKSIIHIKLLNLRQLRLLSLYVKCLLVFNFIISGMTGIEIFE